MTYEDTIRVAELKIRPSRFARVRDEVKANDEQILEIAEFMHPRTQEIADTLPAPLGRWMLRTAWIRRLIDAMTTKGRTVKTFRCAASCCSTWWHRSNRCARARCATRSRTAR